MNKKILLSIAGFALMNFGKKALHVAVLVLLVPALGFSDSTDTVVLKNGNRISGNVKSMAQGQLLFDTDAMGTVTIKMDRVAEILSSTPMEIKTVAGYQLYGKLEKPPLPQQVKISWP